jgi:hypothetical protein
MKAWWTGLLGAALAVEIWAQGQILVSNYTPVENLDAPVYDTDCLTPLAGPAYLAQAYVGIAPDSLSPIGPVLPFRTDRAAGYFASYVLTVPRTSSGTLVYFQLRAWETQAGSSFEAAIAEGGKYGISNVVPMRTVAPPNTPYSPIGLQSFCLVPEPGPGALLLQGGGLWLLLARRRAEERGAS